MTRIRLTERAKELIQAHEIRKRRAAAVQPDPTPLPNPPRLWPKGQVRHTPGEDFLAIQRLERGFAQ